MFRGRMPLHRGSLLLPAILAIVILVASAGPAWSVGGREVLFKWLPCTQAPSGQLLTVAPIGPVDPVPQGGPQYRLSVTLRVTACTTVTGDEVYGVATYYATKAYAFPSYYRDLPTDRSPARATIWLTPGARAVCLAVHTYVRVGCTAVSWDGPGTEPSIGPAVPTDAPAVNVPALLPTAVSNGPGCPVCWT